MDKKIIDKLIGLGLITNSNIDPNYFKDIDSLINSSIITATLSKSKILELIMSDDNIINIDIDTPVEDNTPVETVEDNTPVETVEDNTLDEVSEAAETISDVNDNTDEIVVDDNNDDTNINEVVADNNESVTTDKKPRKSNKK